MCPGSAGMTTPITPTITIATERTHSTIDTAPLEHEKTRVNPAWFKL